MTEILRAFHNDPAVKAKYIARLRAHRAAEHLTQGVGFEVIDTTVKGCAVGCTLEAYDHKRYPIELGLPEGLARLEDKIFEGLPKREAEQFAEDFLSVIPVGVDVTPVRSQLAILRHRRGLVTLAKNPAPYARVCEAAILGVVIWLEAGSPESAARSARSAARSAAWSAAWSAAGSAGSAHYTWEAENLLHLLSECEAPK